MSVREYYGALGRLVSAIDSDSPFLEVNASLSGIITASGFINSEDITYFAVEGGGKYEVVKVIGVSANVLTVEREQGGTQREAFPVGSVVKYIVTVEGVIEKLNEGSALTLPALLGYGLTNVVYDPDNNAYSITVQSPTFEGAGGIEITGDWPEYQINYVTPQGNCCGTGTGGGDGSLAIETQGILNSWQVGETYVIDLQAPTIQGDGNIVVEGSWPFYYISLSNAGGGGVQSVAVGAGLTLTGSPTVNPTLSISNTGVVAGTYGGVSINARGQITFVPLTFNPLSVATAGTNVNIVRTGDEATFNVADAAVGVRGAVALADETDPFDPDDNVNAATPAVVASALAALQGATLSGVTSFTGEVASEYTNLVAPTTQAVTLLAGQKALIIVEATMLDASTPLTPVDFGIALFNSLGIVQGNRKMKQSSQQMTYILSGPYSESIILATTAVPGGATLVSSGLSVVVF